MKALQLLLAERARRNRWREAVLSQFEVTDSNKDRVRRWDVVTAVARKLGIRVVNNFFQQRVIAIVSELGAEPIKPRNKRFYRKLKRRGQPAPG